MDISTWPISFITKNDLFWELTAFIDSGQTCCLPILLLVVVFIIKIVLYGLSLKKKLLYSEQAIQFVFLILCTVLILMKYSSVSWIFKKLIL